MSRTKQKLAAALLAALTGAGCSAPTGQIPGLGPYGESRPVRVVTTTALLADIVSNVGAGRVQVSSMVPSGADPHAYEPGLRAIRDIAYADLAVSNYLMLEEHSLIRAIDSTTAPNVRHISVAEGATRYGAEVISLTENAALETTWLGFRIAGTGKQHGATRSSRVRIIATDIQGPGALSAYITETFGNPTVMMNSADGLSDDAVVLPVDAHTHMSWAFTQPGIYRLSLRAELDGPEGTKALGSGTLRFAVGTDPHLPGGTVVSDDHADITVDANSGGFSIRIDDSDGVPHVEHIALDEAVIDVPPKALAPVPADPAFAFIARPGQEVYQLPQAVLGSHIHGEIDPHLWLDARNVKAYAALLRDELIRLDPAGAAAYSRATEIYLHSLDQLDEDVAEMIAAIPEARRRIVTSHDSFAYLAHAYDIPVAGVVTPNPAIEPSVADRSRLVRTLTGLNIAAVFVSPTEIRSSSTLVEIARDLDVAVCPLLSDTFTPEVASYEQLMRFDAESLRRCLA